jgi:hypothetical protein
MNQPSFIHRSHVPWFDSCTTIKRLSHDFFFFYRGEKYLHIQGLNQIINDSWHRGCMTLHARYIQTMHAIAHEIRIHIANDIYVSTLQTIHDIAREIHCKRRLPRIPAAERCNCSGTHDPERPSVTLMITTLVGFKVPQVALY